MAPLSFQKLWALPIIVVFKGQNRTVRQILNSNHYAIIPSTSHTIIEKKLSFLIRTVRMLYYLL